MSVEPVPTLTRWQQGFTLLELLIAISIAALVVGVGAPAGVRLYDNMQYHGAVSEVVNSMTSARIAAINGGGIEDVVITPDERSLRFADEVRQLPGSITIDVLGARELNRADAGVIRFYPDGSSSGGVVSVVSERGKATEVQVDWLLGKVSLCKGDCGSFR